jgi:hypothetical protein
MRLTRRSGPGAGLLLGLVLLGPAGCGGGSPAGPAGGGASVPRPDLRVKTLNNLRQLGLAYRNAAILGPVTGPGSLGREMAGVLRSPRDEQPFEVVWRFDPGRAAGEDLSGLVLAWEKTADAEGGRCVLFADCATARHLSAAEAQKVQAVKANR